MQLSEERSGGWPKMWSDKSGPEPCSGCWETSQSERKAVAETSTLHWVKRNLILSVIFIKREPNDKIHAGICQFNVALLTSKDWKHLGSFYFWHIYHPPDLNFSFQNCFSWCFIIVSHLLWRAAGSRLVQTTTVSRIVHFYPQMSPPLPAEKCVVSDRPLKIHTPFSNTLPWYKEREVAASHHKGIFLSLFVWNE